MMEGQRALSTLVDIAFFVIVGIFGLNHILSEAVLATLLSGYAAHRFGIASGKQQAIVALSSSGSLPPGSGGGTGSSQKMPAVRQPIREEVADNGRDPRRMQRESMQRENAIRHDAIENMSRLIGWWGA